MSKNQSKQTTPHGIITIPLTFKLFGFKITFLNLSLNLLCKKDLNKKGLKQILVYMSACV